MPASSRRKATEELMKFATSGNIKKSDETILAEEKRKEAKRPKRHPKRKRNHFTRKPFDIDEILGLMAYDTFEKVRF